MSTFIYDVSFVLADAFNPLSGVSSHLAASFWLTWATSQRLKEVERKMLAEAVRFHVEDFGEARSLLQSLKEIKKERCH